MPSVEELLSVAEADANTRSAMDSRIEIDADTRIIRMMPQDELFGVESDEKSERKYFKVPKIVGNGVDLSKLQLRINYQNASKIPSGKDMYIVKDATVYNDEWVYFSWELSRKVTQYKGNIYFIVCAVKADSNGNITNEWNTTLAEGKVLEGLEVETSQEQQYQASDYLEQLKQQLLDYSKEIKDTFPSDYTQMQNDIGSLKGDLSQLSEDVVELEKFHYKKLDYTKGKYLSIASIGNKNYPHLPNENEGYKFAIEECSPRSFVVLNCSGGNGPRAYAFLDADYMTIEMAEPNATLDGITLIAPLNTAYLVVNDSSDRESYIKVYDYVTPELYGAIGDGVTDDTEAFEKCLEQNLPIRLSGKHYLIKRDLAVKNNGTVIEGNTGAYTTNSARLIMNGCSIDLGTYAPRGVRFSSFGIFSDTIGIKMISTDKRIGDVIFSDIFMRCKMCVHLDMETGYIKFIDCNFQNDGVSYADLKPIVYLDYTGDGTNKINYVYFIRCNFEGGSYYYSGGKALVYLNNVTAIQFDHNDFCNCHNAFNTGDKNNNTISITNNFFWNISNIIYNAAGTYGFLFTGNTVYDSKETLEPIIMSGDKKIQVITGNTFNCWSKVTVENHGNVFANNVIQNVIDEVISKLHPGEFLY